MMVERFQNGESICLATSILTDSAGAILPGLADVTAKVRRESDGFWLDWADGVFKASGWTTISGPMSAVDATHAPGCYRLLFSTAGYAADQYYVRMTSPSAHNVPQEAAAIVGGYVDNLDAAISTRATLANQVTIASGIAELGALLHQNAVVDNTAHTGNGTTTARLRGFATPAAAAAATDGAVDDAEGETSRWSITTTYDGIGQVATHRLIRML